MDYPLHYTEEHHQHRHHHHNTSSTNTNHNNNSSGTANHDNNNNNGGSNSFRSFGVFNDRSDIMLFDNNSSASPTIDTLELNEDRSRSMLLMSTRPHVMHDPWNTTTTSSSTTSQHAHHQQLLSTHSNNFSQHANLHNLHHNFSHSERGIAGFVSKLYQCLQSTDTNHNYARWCQHDGKDMFIIDCIPEFTETVLPRLFKHCKFPSFVRQLNIYGFQRDTDARKSKDTKDKESCRWYHPCFRPGRRDLFHLIRRKATRYSRKKRVKTEEDPETILNLGSGDESQGDDENIILLVNQDDSTNEQRCSSSVSSVTQTLQPIEYYPSHQQLQIGYHTETTSSSTTNTSNLLLVEDSNTTATPTATTDASNSNNVVHEESDNAEVVTSSTNSGLVVDTTMHHTDVAMRDQELRLQLYHMKRHFEKMQRYFEEQLSTAQIQIDEQRLRIQQLEEALRITKQQSNVKLNTTNGYMNAVCTTIPNSTTTFNQNYLHMNSTGTATSSGNSTTPTTTTPSSATSTSRLVSQQRSLFDLHTMNKSEVSTPRPTNTPDEEFNNNTNNFYFHENNKIVQIKTENDNPHHHLLHTTPPPPSTSSNTNNNTSSWGPFTHHHRNTFDTKTNGFVAAGSNTINEAIIENDSSHHQHQHRSNNNNKLSLSTHMNYNSYM